jgi:hypothetical protein
MNKDFIVDTGQKFVSNVLGGAGAVWGSSEVVCLRNNNNRRLWRGIAGSFGIVLFGLYLNERKIAYDKFKNRKLVK